MARRSKVLALPEEVRRWLDKALAEGNFSGYEALEAALAERGHTIGKSSLHRYGRALESRLAAVKASTEAARQIADAAPDDADLRSAAVISLIQTDVFNVLLALQEAAEADDPAERLKVLAKAGKSIAELSRASVNQKKWEADVRAKVAAKLDAMESAAKQAGGKAGFDLDTLRRVREEIYGIV